MKRDLSELANNVYDLLIIGGGIYGACVAWDAALRGLRVCLVEKSDFGAATSANSLKIVHGGFRYLQHGDLKRVRESVRERATLMRIAPHLVHPLPVLIPTYGHWMQGKELFSLALMVNELVGFNGNRLNDPQKYIPRGRVISREEVMHLLPDIDRQGLTGGVIFYDAQVYNSERLLLSFLRSAEKASANLANYVEASGFLKDGNCVTGVEAKDVLTGNRFNIRARMVVNTCGPWIDRVLSSLNRRLLNRRVLFAKAINLLTRPVFQTFAVGVRGRLRYRDADSLVNKGCRYFFITPWRGHSLIGTGYSIYEGDPDDFKVTELDIQNFLDEINGACPLASLRRDEVSFVHGGLVPISSVRGENGYVQLAKHYQIMDHRHEGVKGLISVIGVKYTTARDVAEKVVDHVFESWGQKPPKSDSSVTPLHGGHIQQFDAFLEAQITKRPYGLGEEATRRLVYNYGSAYPEVLRHLHRDDGCLAPLDHFALLKAEVLHGVHAEMAQKLSDVILRRTELGTAGHPGKEALRACADIMSAELGWSPERTQLELQEVNDIFSTRH